MVSFTTSYYGDVPDQDPTILGRIVGNIFEREKYQESKKDNDCQQGSHYSFMTVLTGFIGGDSA
jgi:hypothetical protein